MRAYAYIASVAVIANGTLAVMAASASSTPIAVICGALAAWCAVTAAIAFKSTTASSVGTDGPQSGPGVNP